MMNSATLSSFVSRESKPTQVLVWILFGVLLVDFAIIVCTLTLPLIGYHSFRQSQTAISTFWMLHGSSWIDYETPVLGYPWSVPFEFPLYNWIVAILCETSPLNLDESGRVVSVVWLIACLVPVYSLAKLHKLGSQSFVIFAILFLSSPLYLYWGRAFMMETQALCLSLAFLAAFNKAVLDGNSWNRSASILFGTLAALTKITTLFPVYCLAALICATRLIRAYRAGSPIAKPLIGWLIMLVVPLIPFAIWNKHADMLKAGNAIGQYFRSDAPEMIAWNFGSLHERLSGALIKAAGRGLLDVLGWLGPIIIAAVAAGLMSRRIKLNRPTIVVGLLAAFVLPWFVLTNLYIVHNYYLVANGVFLIAALAIVAGDIKRKQLIIACFVVLLSDYSWFATRFGAALTGSPGLEKELQIAEYIRSATANGDVVAIYGLDWSSMVPYYSQRRAVTEPETMIQLPKSFYMAQISHWMQPVGGHPMTAVVRCPSRLDADPDVAAAFKFLASSTHQKQIGDCVIFTRA